MKAIEVVEGKAVLNEAEKPVVGLNEILIKELKKCCLSRISSHTKACESKLGRIIFHS